MIQEFFIALFKAGLPVGMASYLLVWWALRNGYLGEVETMKDVEQEVKRLVKDKQAKKNGDPLHRKWLAMGGGFYGVVALITLAVIELGEVRDFIASFNGIGAFIASLGVGFIISLVIETIRNFITAITWPVYWLTNTPGEHAWISLIVAYGGYWLGSHLATQHHNKRERGTG